MERVSIFSKTEEEWLQLRTKDITSTEVSALFGLSPYTTAFELYHVKKSGEATSFEAEGRVLWGQRLQDAIAAGVAEDKGWEVEPMKEYMRIPTHRMGSSFDFSILSEPVPEPGPQPGNGILEIKNVDGLQFQRGWIVDGDDIEAPAHIELQVQHQLAVSGRAFAYIAAFVGGNRTVLIRREPDQAIIGEIFKRVAAFWHGVDTNNPPEPEFKRDAEFIAKLHGYAQPGKFYMGERVAEIETMVHTYSRLGKEIKELDDQRAAIKAQILMEIQDSEKFKTDTCSISAGVIGPKAISYERKGYRDFRCFLKKEK